MTSRSRAREICARILGLLLLLAVFAPVGAQETITYTYDARGRLVNVDHGTTGPNAGVSSAYTYDNADNRTQVVVNAGNGTTITLSPTTLPSGTVGTAYTSTTLTASGGTSPYTYMVTSGSLPGGLTLSSSGTLSGTPTTAATSTFTITATDSASHTGNQSYSVTVSPANNLTLSPATLPSGTVGTAYTSTTITATGGTSPYTFTKSSGTLPAGLTLSSGGVLSGTPTTATTYSFTVKATDSTGNHIGSKTYSVTVSPSNTLTLSPSTLPGGTVGTAYSYTITASGGTSPYTFAKSSGTLPAGLTLSSGGVLSGIPTTAATYSFTIQATDSTGNHIGTRSYSVTIAGGGVTLTLSPTSLLNGTVGTSYSQQITASGGTSPYTYAVSVGTLPAGLTLSSAGLLSGTPTTASTYSFTIKATDSSSNTGTRAYSVTVNSGGLIANSWSQTISACGTANVDVVSQLHDSDPDGDTITVSGVSNVDPLGTASYSGTVVTYSTSASRGSGGLTYTISDGKGQTANNTMSFNISGGVCP